MEIESCSRQSRPGEFEKSLLTQMFSYISRYRLTNLNDILGLL